jgi:hypothetical protein
MNADIIRYAPVEGARDVDTIDPRGIANVEHRIEPPAYRPPFRGYVRHARRSRLVRIVEVRQGMLPGPSDVRYERLATPEDVRAALAAIGHAAAA